MTDFRTETDSLGPVEVPADKLWGAQTQRALTMFDIGNDLMPPEMIEAYAVLKKACALANHEAGQLDEDRTDFIVAVCDELLEGRHRDMFPLSVWISGSGTQFNMNVNEVIANRSSQLAGTDLGSKAPVHPNDHVNISQSTNDNFPSAMYMAAAMGIVRSLIPAAEAMRDNLAAKATEWQSIVKIGRTHMQDATPLTLGQEFSGYAGVLDDSIMRVREALPGVCMLPLGGTAVGTGINAYKGFDRDAIKHISDITGLPFMASHNKFKLQGSHDALVHLSAALKTLAVGLNKIACDIRMLACGPRAGISELILPANEPGSSIMPGKVNPTQCESMTMVALQVMANDQAVTMGGTSGNLEMNVYKPLMIFNVMNSIRTMADSMTTFTANLLEGLTPNTERLNENMKNSLMLVTALSPAIGYENAAHIAHNAHEKGLSLKESALALGLVTEAEFDKIVVPENMV